MIGLMIRLRTRIAGLQRSAEGSEAAQNRGRGPCPRGDYRGGRGFRRKFVGGANW